MRDTQSYFAGAEYWGRYGRADTEIFHLEGRGGYRGHDYARGHAALSCDEQNLGLQQKCLM